MTRPGVRLSFASRDTARGLGGPYTVVFDGTCNVCSQLARVLRTWDRNRELEIVPSEAPGVSARVPWIPPRAYREALQLIGPDGRTWQGSAAIEQLLNVLPKGKLISWIFRIPYGRRVADRWYRWFARNRYRFGCGPYCRVRPLDVGFDE